MAKKNSSKKTATATPTATADQAPPADQQEGSLPFSGGFEVYDHPVADLKARGIRQVSPEKIEALAKSIRENGLLFPILIGTDGTVIDGDSRLAAFALLKRETIPVRYAQDSRTNAHLESTNARAFAQTLVSNLQRNTMTPIEIGKVFAQAIAEKIAPDAKSLAKMLGVSTGYVSKYMGLSEKGVPALQKELAEGRITVEAANAIISRSKSEADQVALLTNLLTASDGKITIQHVEKVAPAGTQVEQDEETTTTTTTRRRGRPAGRRSSRVTLPGSAMPESGRISTQLARSADGDWAVSVTVTVPHGGKTFQAFDVVKKLQAEIVSIDNAAVRKELELARERLGG